MGAISHFDCNLRILGANRNFLAYVGAPDLAAISISKRPNEEKKFEALLYAEREALAESLGV